MQIGKVGERGERTERKKGEVGGELEGEIDRGREGVTEKEVFRGLAVMILTSQHFVFAKFSTDCYVY